MICVLNSDLIQEKKLKHGNSGFVTQFITRDAVGVGKRNDPTIRVIVTESHTSEDPIQSTNPVRVITKKLKNGGINCSLREILPDQLKKELPPVYLVAIPFNGLMKPMEKSPLYRVHRAFIAKLPEPAISQAYDKLVGSENEKFRRIAYFVITPSVRALKTPDGVTIPFVTYHLAYKNGKTVTIKETYKIGLTYDEIVDSFVVTQQIDRDEHPPVDIQTLGGGHLFPIYQPPERRYEKKEKKSDLPRQIKEEKRSTKPQKRGKDPNKNNSELKLERMLNNFEISSKDRQHQLGKRDKKRR